VLSVPLTVVGYVRVSTDEQLDSGAGLEAQRRAIRDECQRRGWRLADIYEDAASGRALTGRSGLKAALAALDGRVATALVVAKLDRLSRSARPSGPIHRCSAERRTRAGP
jgi:DNA invertase Pin-like site-specific DNA recombinase